MSARIVCDTTASRIEAGDVRQLVVDDDELARSFRVFEVGEWHVELELGVAPGATDGHRLAFEAYGFGRGDAAREAATAWAREHWLLPLGEVSRWSRDGEKDGRLRFDVGDGAHGRVQRARIGKWRAFGTPRGDRPADEIGTYATLEVAQQKVEDYVAAKKSSKSESTEAPAIAPGAVEEYTIEEIAEEVAEKLQLVVMRIEATFAPKLDTEAPEEYPTVDGELHRETRSLPTKLTDEEVDQFGTELAENVAKINVLDNLLGILRDGLKPTQKGLDSRVNALSGLVRRRERIDVVPCAHVLAADASRVEIIRLDTGAAVETRKPKKGEGQTRLGGT